MLKSLYMLLLLQYSCQGHKNALNLKQIKLDPAFTSIGTLQGTKIN